MDRTSRQKGQEGKLVLDSHALSSTKQAIENHRPLRATLFYTPSITLFLNSTLSSKIKPTKRLKSDAPPSILSCAAPVQRQTRNPKPPVSEYTEIEYKQIRRHMKQRGNMNN